MKMMKMMKLQNRCKRVLINRPNSSTLQQGLYIGPAQTTDMHRIRIFPSEHEEVVSIHSIHRRRVQPRCIYAIQRYDGIVRV